MAKPIVPHRFFRPFSGFLLEILSIFLGITISFLFDEWRTGQQQKQEKAELVRSFISDFNSRKQRIESDNKDSQEWIANLDTIRLMRVSKTIPPSVLIWFYKVITHQVLFAFDPGSPTYTSASTTGMWTNLPDSIRSRIYYLYEVRFQYCRKAYEDQEQIISGFRSAAIHSASVELPLAETGNLQPDLKKLSQEISTASCGDLIDQMLIQENICLKQNNITIANLDKLTSYLKRYLSALEIH